MVSPSRATAAAPPIVALASPSSRPELLSLPSLVTYSMFFVSTPAGLQDTPEPTEASL